MTVAEKVRIDKWLWAVRIFKTRSMATEACKNGRIIINGMEVKPSHEVRPGEIIFVRKLPVIYTLQVKDLINNRLPAQRVKEYVDDLTSPEELEKLKLNDTAFFKRDRGTGRPTKRERRLLDDIINSDK
jgi:ribosome-associated heat shock protein Hsp15